MSPKSTLRVVLPAIFLVFGLPQGRVDAGDDPGSPKVAAPPGGVVVARVGPREIRESVLRDAATRALNRAYFHRDAGGAQRLALEKESLAALIRHQFDILGALDRGLRPDFESARRSAAEMEKKIGKKAYEAGIAGFGWSREGHVREVAESTLGEFARRTLVDEPAVVSEDELKAEHERVPESWIAPPSIHVEHILLKLPAGSSPADRVRREKEARAIVAEIRGGRPFAEVATAKSENDYRIRGGDTGWLHRGRLLPEIEGPLWAAKTGELVGPIVTDEGIFIARVVERRDERPLEWEEIAPRLRASLEACRLEEAETAFYEPLRARYPVTILDERLRGR